MTRNTRVQFSVSSDDGHTTHFSTSPLTGMAETIRIVIEFDNGRGKITKNVIDLPVEFLDPDDIRVQFTDPPPSADRMRAVGERLVQLAEELNRAEPQFSDPKPGDSS